MITLSCIRYLQYYCRIVCCKEAHAEFKGGTSAFRQKFFTHMQHTQLPEQNPSATEAHLQASKGARCWLENTPASLKPEHPSDGV